MGVVLLIVSAIYFMLPAYFANMAPVMLKNAFSFLAIPIDGGRTLGGKPLLGAHKTWRGFILAVVFGVILAFVQYLLSDVAFFSSLALVSYDRWFVLGLLLGSGAIMGDLVGSFFKRRKGVASGKPWIPWDQLDFVLGALLFASLAVPLTFSFVLTVIIVSFALDIVVNHLAFFLKIRGERW